MKQIIKQILFGGKNSTLKQIIKQILFGGKNSTLRKYSKRLFQRISGYIMYDIFEQYGDNIAKCSF